MAASFHMTGIWIEFAIIAAFVALFALDFLPVIAVCMGAALALWATAMQISGAAGGPLRAVGPSGAGDLQHRDIADRHSHRHRRRRPDGHLGLAG
jgi:hypothetical protein